MTGESAGSGLEPAVHAYARDSVDDFLAAAEVEKEHLRRVIAEAEARERRARASIGMQRVMVSMLLEVQREIADERERAELEAADIVAAADQQAVSIVQAARDEVAGAGGPRVGSYPRRSPVDERPALALDPESTTLDLASAERREQDDQRRLHPSSPEYPSAGAGATSGNGFARDSGYPTSSLSTSDAGEDERFFAYLRGALADDQPLGPRAD
jgi:hypothetical protein